MPFNPDERWSCNAARDCLLYVTEELAQRGLLTPTVFPDTVDNVVRRCQSCRASSPKVKACTGWLLMLRDTSELVFSDVEVHGRNVRVVLTGLIDRRMKSSAEYGRAPARSTVAIAVLVGSDIATRQHIDFAEREQCAPAWHLQLGGLPGQLGPKGDFEWLDIPRWPAQPMDLMLAIELVLYSLRYETWRQLTDDRTWNEWLKRSESLTLRPYFERLSDYWNQRHTVPTWLYAQCNRRTPWPRATGA